MKVLILTDEQYAEVAKIAPPVKMKLKLPRAQELHRMARNGSAPDAFALARERMEAATDAAETTRAQMHKLITEADDLGVKTGALARWSGYTDRRIHQIVTSARRA